jgi:hypothetical protein
MYRRRPYCKHQTVVPKSLVRDIIWANHDPIYIAHPGMKRTFDLFFLKFWWPGMRLSIEHYVRSCDPCQRRKDKICCPFRKNGGAHSPFRGHEFRYYGIVSYDPSWEQIFTDFYRQFHQARGGLSNSGTDRRGMCQNLCHPVYHASRHRVHADNWPKQSVRFFFQWNVQDIGSSESEYVTVPSL